MIRFECPGCSAQFSVDDAKGGKTGKCPKCNTQFIIPDADPPAAPASAPSNRGTPPPPSSRGVAPPPLPPPAADEPVDIKPCPKCSTQLTVNGSDLGLDVECPTCATVFKAERPGSLVPAPPPPPPKRSALESTDPTGKPKSRRGRDDDEESADDDRPRSRRRRDDDDDDADERPSRRRRDDDEDDRPSRRKKSKRSRRSTQESKRITAGVLALLLGGFGVHKFYLGYNGAGVIILLLTCCTGLGGIIALVEGIIYLVKSDEEFIETYQEGTKEWF
jgi:predicted Zn finger-like uncharacterized protein